MTEDAHICDISRTPRSKGKAGMPAGPLAAYDEVALVLGQKVRKTHEALETRMGSESGVGLHDTATRAVIDPKIEKDRGGRHHGGGVYNYAADWSKSLRSELDRFAKGKAEVSIEDAVDRLLSRQAIETLRCLDEGVPDTEVEANRGGISAFGFPAHTGGAIQLIRGIGVDRFAARTRARALSYGERFAITARTFDRLPETGRRSA